VVELPRNVVIAAERHGWHRPWVGRLPAVVAEVARRLDLDLGPPFQPGGATAWVAPARDRAGRDLVVKIGWRHPEAEHEADGLRFWDGDGVVRLHAAGDGPGGHGADEVDDETFVLLLERCVPGTELARRPGPEQDDVLAGLFPRLWRQPPAGHPFRPLQAMCEQWADEFEVPLAAGLVPLDPGLARAGIALLRTLPATAERHVLLATDLHAGNVLVAEREPWLVVDPKPYVGDPTFDPLQHLINCGDRLQADPCGLCDGTADRLGLDRQRLRRWLFARLVKESPRFPFAAELVPRLAPA
jgi:streptomycin 6-kinase